MRISNVGSFYRKLQNKKNHYPLSCLIELTYRCNLNCIHCFCKGSEDKERELSTKEWKRALDLIQKEGCIWITFSGGDPLVKDDFLEIYSYAKKKGFIITLFTNAVGFKKEIFNFLVKSPPFSIEATLNGITEETYESITQTPGSFSKVMKNIHRLAGEKMKLTLKTNILKENKHELGRIKAFTEQLLGKPSKNKHYFKYDPMIYPRLNGDRSPCNHRLSSEELLEVKKQDMDIWEEYQKGLHSDIIESENDDSPYRCNAWMGSFFINPYGKLKFCEFSEKFSIDLRTSAFKEGFYSWPAKILNQTFKTNSKCQNCHLRPLCYHCPARAYLENRNEEAPVEYYCQLAKATAGQRDLVSHESVA